MVYILNLKGPAPFLIQYIFSLYQGLRSYPEADNIPMCHPASFKHFCLHFRQKIDNFQIIILKVYIKKDY